MGATSVSKPRSDFPSEVKRIQASFQRAALLCSIGMGWSRSLRAHKTFVLSKFSYGWVARPCTLGVSKKLFTWLSRALKTGTNASPWLRKILYGAQTDMSCVSMTRQWTRLRKRILCNHRPSWNLGVHTSIHILRKKLHTMGWREVEPWLWKKPPLWDQLTPHDFRILDLRTLRQDEQLQLHTLRLAYKQQCFVNLLEQKKTKARGHSAPYSVHVGAALSVFFGCGFGSHLATTSKHRWRWTRRVVGIFSIPFMQSSG